MRDILAEIVEKKRAIVAEAKARVPLEALKEKLTYGSFAMSHSFGRRPWSLIAECKLQSPAKGRLTKSHSVLELAKLYEENGAHMLSVHTDPHFLGSNEDFQAVRAAVKLPLLRKDFVIDPYQIYEARALGADAVLLIARILSREELKKFLYLCWSLGMDALVEVHDRADLAAAHSTPADYIGINNRNLVTFETSPEETVKLMPYAEKGRRYISESGIFGRSDAELVAASGVTGILVGEGLVRADDVGAMTRLLAEGIKAQNIQEETA